eukprot:2788104-Alexandrium_andersonii.AAC.1
MPRAGPLLRALFRGLSSGGAPQSGAGVTQSIAQTSGWPASAGGAAPSPDPAWGSCDPWAGASLGQDWASSPQAQGRPNEYSVDLRMWSDSYS